jgi:putative Holliday junction resolvase
MTVLALDVGERRIGVAISDPGGTFALPHSVIERTAVREDVEQIVTLAREYGAGTLVVGDPVRLEGDRGPAAERIDGFVRHLERVWGATVERVDERLTTAQATKTLIAADVSRSARKKLVDKLAAALILETFLARRRTDR